MNIKEISCRGAKAIYVSEHEMLRSTKPYTFLSTEEGIQIQTVISEQGCRTISITATEDIKVHKLYAFLVTLERLLRILDGSFVPMREISFLGDEKEEDYKSLECSIVK